MDKLISNSKFVNEIQNGLHPSFIILTEFRELCFTLLCFICLEENLGEKSSTGMKICGLTEQELGHKAMFKARTERDKARQPFCCACAIE